MAKQAQPIRRKMSYIHYKMLSNRTRIHKSAFKDQKPRTFYFIAPWDHPKTVKVIKVLRVKYAPVTGVARGIVWLITTEVWWSDITTSLTRWLVNQKKFKQNRNKIQKFGKGKCWLFWMIVREILWNYFKDLYLFQ